MVSRDQPCSLSSRTYIVVFLIALSWFEHRVQGFAPLSLHHPPSLRHLQTTSSTATVVVRCPQPLAAGGFEWDDPEEAFDQGVENPFKKNTAQVVDTNSDDDDDNDAQLKVDPARLLSPRLNGSNLYFVGMMGAGKSAVGQIVAKRMGTYSFLDTDEIIEKVTQTSIPELFAAEGEDSFRDVESQVLHSVYPYVRCVISTGGGMVIRSQNWSKLQTGIVVWLDVAPDVIMERIRGTDRPLLQTDDPLQTLETLLEERREMYRQADVRIEIKDNSMDAKAVADQIVRDLHDFIDENPPSWKLAKEKAQSEGLDWVE